MPDDACSQQAKDSEEKSFELKDDAARWWWWWSVERPPRLPPIESLTLRLTVSPPRPFINPPPSAFILEVIFFFSSPRLEFFFGSPRRFFSINKKFFFLLHPRIKESFVVWGGKKSSRSRKICLQECANSAVFSVKRRSSFEYLREASTVALVEFRRDAFFKARPYRKLLSFFCFSRALIYRQRTYFLPLSCVGGRHFKSRSWLIYPNEDHGRRRNAYRPAARRKENIN